MSNLNRGSNIDIGGGSISFNREGTIEEADLTMIPQELRDMEITVGTVTYKDTGNGEIARIDEKGKTIGKTTKEKMERILKERRKSKSKPKTKAAGMEH